MAFSGGARGQGTGFSSGSDAVVTLMDALELAERNRPELARAGSELEAARAAQAAARMAFLPSVDASTVFEVTRLRRFTTTNVFGDPEERDQAIEATSRGASQGVAVDWTLFDGGKTLAEARAAGARRRVAEATLEVVRARIRAEVARAYVHLLEKRRILEVERAVLQARRRDVETTERRFRVVAADRLDVLGAEIEERRQEVIVATAEGAVLTAGLELTRVVGMEIDPEARLSSPFDPFDPDSLDVEAMVRAALDAHPEIRDLAARAEVVEAEVRDDGWVAYLPRVTVRASYRRSEFGGSSQPFFELDPRDTAYDFGLWLSVPIFDRFARRAERAQAEAAIVQGRTAVRSRRLEAEVEIRSRFLELRSAWQSFVIEMEGAGMARERSGLARTAYESGGIDFTRLQQVLDDGTASERELVRRRFDYCRALVELERAVGRPLLPPAG